MENQASSDNTKLSLGLLQFDIIWENVTANLKKIEALISVQPMPELIVLPEMFSTGFTMKPASVASENLKTVVPWMQAVSEKHGIGLCGSLCVEVKGAYVNRLYFYDSGKLLTTYDKRHLFTLAGEEKVYTAGSEGPSLEFRSWKIRPLICYDLRFPVWCRNKTRDDLYIFVANWPEKRSYAWQQLLRARAIENLAYVAGVNRVGLDGNGIAHNGASALINGLGETLQERSQGEEGMIFETLSLDHIRDIRSRFGFLEDADDFILRN